MSMTIGFIGLGSLGVPVATNLIEAGYEVRVYNRTPGKASALIALGAKQCDNPAEVTEPGGVVVSLLWDGTSLKEVVQSKGFLDGLGKGGLHISMSTVAPEDSRQVAAWHQLQGSNLVEAPVFGRPEAAANKALSIVFAGSTEAKERARPILTALGGKNQFDMGEKFGSALLVKVLGNFLLVSFGRFLAEGLAITSQQGGDTRALMEVLNQILLPLFKGYGERAIQGLPTTGQSAIPAKDVGILAHLAKLSGTPVLFLDFLGQNL
jgi:3-hydroxyisobutyrate dehydrogenase-like beta-hydroxyacid dehydrogenase